MFCDTNESYCRGIISLFLKELGMQNAVTYWQPDLPELKTWYKGKQKIDAVCIYEDVKT